MENLNIMENTYVNRLSVPMRKEDNEALSKVRRSYERSKGRSFSKAEVVRRLILDHALSNAELQDDENQLPLPL